MRARDTPAAAIVRRTSLSWGVQGRFAISEMYQGQALQSQSHYIVDRTNHFVLRAVPVSASAELHLIGRKAVLGLHLKADEPALLADDDDVGDARRTLAGKLGSRRLLRRFGFQSPSLMSFYTHTKTLPFNHWGQ
jgi:hypothetical protein